MGQREGGSGGRGGGGGGAGGGGSLGGNSKAHESTKGWRTKQTEAEPPHHGFYIF